MKISESGRLDGAQPLAEPPAAPRVDLAAPAATRQTHSDVAHMSPPVPASLEAEQGVLGCCLLDARAVTECAARLRSPEAFYDLRHLEIYETLVAMVDAGKPVDLYTAQVALKSKGVPSRLVFFPDENHWILKPQNSRLWYREFFAWLKRHVATGGKPKRR